MADLGTLTARLGVDTTGLSRAEARMATFGNNAVGTFARVRRMVFSLQGALLALGVGFSLRRVLTEAAAYESAMVDMARVTDQSFGEIDAQIRSLDASLGTHTQLLQGYYQVISAGVTDPVRAMDMLVTASKAAQVAGVSQGDTVKALTKLMAGYAGAIKDASTAADLLLTIEKLGQTQMSELIPVIGNNATMARLAGLKYQEMAGALALITQTAGSTAEASTQLDALMTSLLRPTSEMEAAFKDAGGAIQFIKDQGLVEWLEEILRVTGGKEEVLSSFLGGRKESLMGLAALLAQLEQLDENIKQMDDNTGALDRAWALLQGTWDQAWKTLKTNITNSMKTLGLEVLPALTAAVQWLNTNFTMVIETMQMIAKVAGMYALLRLAQVIIPAVIKAVQTLRLQFHLLSLNITGTGWAASRSATAIAAMRVPLWGVALSAHAATKALFSLNAVMAGLVGWQIGKYLHEQFETARFAGILMVDVLSQSIMFLRQTWELASLGMKQAWMLFTNDVKRVFGEMLRWIGSQLAKVPNWIPFGKTLSEMGRALQGVSPSYVSHLGLVNKHIAQIEELRIQHGEERKAHRDKIDAMIVDARNYKKTIDQIAGGMPEFDVDMPEFDGVIPPIKGIPTLPQGVPTLPQGVQGSDQEDRERRIKDLIKTLELQRDTFWMTADAARLYTLRQEGLGDAVDDVIAPLLAQIRALEAQKEALDIYAEAMTEIGKIGKTEYQLEIERIEAIAARWLQAGVERVDVERWVAEQLKELQEDDYWQTWLESAEKALTSFDEMAGNVLDRFVSGFGQAFERMIFDAEDLRTAIHNLASGIARSMTRAIGEMIAQWLTYKLVTKATNMATGASMAAAKTAEAQAASMMAGLNAYASTAAVPVAGPGQAPAAMATALAATQPVAASIGALYSGAAASYEGGGFTGYGSRSGGIDGRGGFPAILHPQETIIDHTRGQGFQEQQPIRIVNVLDPSIVEDWANSASGERVIMNMVRRNM